MTLVEIQHRFEQLAVMGDDELFQVGLNRISL